MERNKRSGAVKVSVETMRKWKNNLCKAAALFRETQIGVVLAGITGPTTCLAVLCNAKITGGTRQQVQFLPALRPNDTNSRGL